MNESFRTYITTYVEYFTYLICPSTDESKLHTLIFQISNESD
jgi:hypothetical protein